MRLRESISILILRRVEHVFKILSLLIVSHIAHRGRILNDLNGGGHSLII